MSTNYKFEGWLGHDRKSADGNMKWESYEPKKWSEEDVDIEITHCGIRGSDLHTLRSGMEAYRLSCVGHEIVGRAVRVGSKAERGIKWAQVAISNASVGKLASAKVGDRVGVGPQSGSCLKPDCEQCANGEENHCQIAMIDTYDSQYPNGDKSYGGYASHGRVPSHFVCTFRSLSVFFCALF